MDCEPCDNKCASCSTTSSNCDNCRGNHRSAAAPDCLCFSGYYDDGGINC